jgi:opacity protein-like surface antigen
MFEFVRMEMFGYRRSLLRVLGDILDHVWGVDVLKMEGFFMRTKFWSGIGVLASIAASVGAAGAADLAVKAPVYKAPPPVILSDWAGLYIGVHGGGGWADNKFDLFPRDNVTATGGLGGGHVGYNWQFGSVVAGVEGDFDGADLKATDVDNFTHKTDMLASARARLGYVFVPNLLAYGTAGAGWGHSKISSVGSSTSFDQFGWVAGAGLEYKLWGPISVRAEYLHYDFGSKSFTDFNFGTDRLKESVDVVRGGISYKF